MMSARLAPLAALAALAALALVATAEAAPRVEVRARTVIQLDPIARTSGGVVISGQVTDRASPQPVPFASVRIQLDAQSRRVELDEEGRFRLELPAREGRHDLAVAFSGDDWHDPASEQLRGFDVSNEPLELDLSAHPAADDSVELVLRASSGGVPAQVSTVLWVGDLAAPELRRNPDPLVTDARGRATLTLSRDSLGGFGQKRAEARFAGDDTYDPAAGSVVFNIEAATSIELHIDEAHIAFEDKLRTRGRVTDETGAALPDQRITLAAGGREVAEATSDETGRFAMAVEASELGEGDLEVYAALSPSASWLEPARSRPQVVHIGARQPVPLGATLAAFGATFAALLAFVGLRTRPWEAWLARLRRREPEPTDAAAFKERRATGLSPARPSLVSTLRRPNDFGFSSTVCDAVTGRPIANAVLRLELGGEERRQASGADGGLVVESLSPGQWRARVRADGYVSESFLLDVPHRGELRNTRVDLLAVRERIFDMYGEVAAPQLPDPELWGVWTPRQIVDHVRQNRPAPVLGELTDYVEEIYFSQRNPDEEALPEAAARIDRVRRELGGRP